MNRIEYKFDPAVKHIHKKGIQINKTSNANKTNTTGKINFQPARRGNGCAAARRG